LTCFAVFDRIEKPTPSLPPEREKIDEFEQNVKLLLR
jgi:hypothetical protein